MGTITLRSDRCWCCLWLYGGRSSALLLYRDIFSNDFMFVDTAKYQDLLELHLVEASDLVIVIISRLMFFSEYRPWILVYPGNRYVASTYTSPPDFVRKKVATYSPAFTDCIINHHIFSATSISCLF